MSFGQEIRDFIAGFEGGQKMRNAAADREYQQARTEALRAGPSALEIEDVRSQINLRNAQARNQGDTALDIEVKRAQADANRALAELRRAKEGDDWDAIAGSYGDTPAAPTSALPFAETPTPSGEHRAAKAMAASEDIPTREIVRNAGVMSFAPTEAPASASAIPVGPEKPATPAERPRLPKGSIEKLWAKIDPDGTMPIAERNFRAFSHIYRHYTERGEGEKAKKAASDLYRYYKDVSGQYAAFAKAAVESGDMESAVKAVEKYYAFVPDGLKLEAGRQEDGSYAFSFIDIESGQVVQEGVAAPKDIAAQIMNIVPGDFEEYIAGAAGLEYKRPPASTVAVGTPAELEKRLGQVNEAFEQVSEGLLDPEDPTYPQVSAAIQNMATKVQSASGESMTPYDAVATVMAITAVDKDNPNKLPYKVITRDPRQVTVRLSDGRSVTMPTEVFDEAKVLRWKGLEEALTKAGKDVRARERGVARQDILGGVKDAFSRIGSESSGPSVGDRRRPGTSDSRLKAPSIPQRRSRGGAPQ